MNRKLIRTTLAEVKERELHTQHHPRRAPEPPPMSDRGDRAERAERAERMERAERPERAERSERHERTERPAPPPPAPKKKIPPEQTNAESFYYKKQMDSHTPMVIVLQDNETLQGTIEWYDKNSIKLHRDGAPNLLILKHNIKYMYKDQDDE